LSGNVTVAAEALGRLCIDSMRIPVLGSIKKIGQGIHFSVPANRIRRRLPRAEDKWHLDESARHCQVNRLQNELALMTPVYPILSHLLDRRLLSPDPKRFGPRTPITGGAEPMAPWPEMTVNDGVRQEEILRLVT
jgi:hypothetical protein